MTKQLMERFEKWASNNLPEIKNHQKQWSKDGFEYKEQRLQSAWLVWQSLHQKPPKAFSYVNVTAPQGFEGFINLFWRETPIALIPADIAKEIKEAIDTPPLHDWVACKDRLPTEEDGDANRMVWFYKDGDMGCILTSIIQINEQLQDGFWKPTGLKKPEPPKETRQ